MLKLVKIDWTITPFRVINVLPKGKHTKRGTENMKKEVYSFKVTGTERKVVAQIIAKATNQAATYAGPPSFAYEVGDISIDRAGRITTLVDESLKNILIELKENGVVAEGYAEITILMDEHTGVSLRNLVNIISSKEKLLNMALGRSGEIMPKALIEAVNAVRLEEAEDFALAIKDLSTGGLSFDSNRKTISFSFYKATLELDMIKAYMALSIALHEQAKKQKYSSFLQKEVDNEKYAFRCFLLRLGFIGEEFKTERKLLLSRLEGNGAFKVKAAKVEEFRILHEVTVDGGNNNES